MGARLHEKKQGRLWLLHGEHGNQIGRNVNRRSTTLDFVTAERAEELLTDTSLTNEVDTVLRRIDDGYRAASAEGWTQFRRVADGFDVIDETALNPLRNQKTDDRTTVEAEQADPGARLGDHATPHAMESVAQYFDSPHAPDMVIIHAPTHRFHENAGEHGSLSATQARAPFIAAGAGVVARGIVDEHLRTVDVAPTLAALMGLPLADGHDGLGAARSGTRLIVQDGDERSELIDPDGHADHVVVFLWDGVNINTLHEEAAAGRAPHVASLIATGTSYRHGAFASLPTATLANHMTQSTGVFPGRSGVLHNAWHDRQRGHDVDLLDLAQMITARDHLRTDIETLHEAVHRADPHARTATTYEYGDRGADYSTYALMASGQPVLDMSKEERRRHRTAEFMAEPQFRSMSVVDAHSMSQACQIWRGDLGALPRFSWFTLNLTDPSGHVGGPASDLVRAAIRDSDARMGEVIGEIQRSGALERTAIVMMADHGMQQISESQPVDLSVLLTGAGIGHRMIDDQYVYLH